MTVDPHKVMAVPYAVSALLTKKPENLRLISSYSDLIMQEDFAFGQVTPFIGTKSWASLKLWMMMRAHGRTGLARLIEHRLDTTRQFVVALDQRPRFLRLHNPDLTAVAFLYLPAGIDLDDPDIDRINAVNQEIHQRLLDEGRWHLHQFSIPDPGRLRLGVDPAPAAIHGRQPADRATPHRRGPRSVGSSGRRDRERVDHRDMGGRPVTPTPTDFRAVYHAPGVYEQVLLPHYFDGVEDTELVARLMRQHYGRPGNNQNLNVLDLGCGTGRVTAMLAPYAHAFTVWTAARR